MMDQAQKLRKILQDQPQTMSATSTTARVITVTSGKGGVGKTNVTVNMAIQLKKAGKRVVIIDADFGLANIEVLFGIVPKYSLADVMNGQKTISDILTQGPMGIQFISGGSGVQELVKIKDYQLKYFIQNLTLLDKMADVILIDTGAGLSDTVLSFAKAANEVLLVTTPEPTSITDAYALIKTLRNQQTTSLPEIKLLVNRVDDAEEGKEIFFKLKQVCERFLDIQIHELGYIPYDSYLVKAVKLQQPVSISFPKSNVTRSFEYLANKLMDTEYEQNTKISGITSFMKRLVNIFGN